jgi:integrase
MVERGRLPVSPVTGMKLPARERARDRALTDDELRWLWRACEAVEWPFGPLVKLLLLTAQRRKEVAGIERAELDLEKGIWAMPREKAKNNRAHTVQLSTAALKVLNSIPQIGGRFVFTVTGTAPVSGFSRAKRRLDAAMLATKRDELSADCEPIPHWTLHDLRRTATTGMAQLNIPPHVVDKVLNHISGTIRGVAAVYNRFEYLDERRAALEAWGRYVSALVTPAPANVVALRPSGESTPWIPMMKSILTIRRKNGRTFLAPSLRYGMSLCPTSSAMRCVSRQMTICAVHCRR